MTEMLLGLLASFLRLLPLVAALLAVRMLNTHRRDRVRQFLMPPVAFLFALVALVLLYRFNGWVDAVVDVVTRYLPIVSEWYGPAWLYIVENTFVILLFFMVKLVLKPLFVRLFTGDEGIGAEIVARVYEYDPDRGFWFIRSRFGNLRIYYKVLYVSSFILALVLLTLAVRYSTWPGFRSVAFPALAVLVVGELFFSVDGLTKQELDRDVLGEADQANRIVNYGALRRVLRETFGERVLADGVNLSTADPTDSMARLEELKRSPEDEAQIAGIHYQRLKDGGQLIDVNLVDAAVALMEKKSVLINNPFYLDLTSYLAFPAYYHLLQHRKCLIISGRDSLADDLSQWMAKGLEAITGLPDLWSVEIMTSYGSDGLDIGVLRFADLHNLDLVRANDEFLQQVEYVILAEPSRMLATGQLGIGLVLGRCSRGSSPVFAAFDRNNDGLVDALSHLLKVTMTEVVASALPSGSSAGMVWRADGPHMHTNVLPAISRYLGMGTEISAVALKYHVSEVVWVGGDRFPVEDMMWIAGQYYGQINAFAGLDLSQEALTNSLKPLANPWGLGKPDHSFMVVEDEISNVFESVRLYSTRAQDAVFVNLISEDYLLRDYMVANNEIFRADPKAIPSIVADYARTERNAVLRLILMMMTFDVPDYTVAKEFELIGSPVPDLVPAGGSAFADGEPPVLTMLREAIARQTGAHDVYIVTSHRPGASGSGHEESTHDHYRIGQGSGLEEVIESLRSAYFFVEDEREDSHYIGALLYGHVYQALLPGQFITYGGKYYEVQSIARSGSANGVVLRRAAEHVRDRRAYRQLRDFTLSDVTVSDGVGARTQVGEVVITHLFATIDVNSIGYLELPSRSDFVVGRRVSMSGIPSRRYTGKAVLEISLPAVTPAVRRTIAMLLNELFVTVFPHAYQYVVALTTDPDREFGDLLPGLDLGTDSDSIFIVEDSLIDLGLIVAVERNWERLFAMATDYLEWTQTPMPEPDDAVVQGEFEPAFAEPVASQPKDKRSWLRRLIDKIKAFVGRTMPGEPKADAGMEEQDRAPEGQEPASPENAEGIHEQK